MKPPASYVRDPEVAEPTTKLSMALAEPNVSAMPASFV